MKFRRLVDAVLFVAAAGVMTVGLFFIRGPEPRRDLNAPSAMAKHLDYCRYAPETEFAWCYGPVLTDFYADYLKNRKPDAEGPKAGQSGQ